MMKKKNDPVIKQPFSTRSTQIQNNSPTKLPFSLHDPITIEAMTLSGIQAGNLEILPFNHFINTTPTLEIAKISYKRHLEKRKDLINQIEENRKTILNSSNQTNTLNILNNSNSEHNTNNDNTNSLDTFYTNINSIPRNKNREIKVTGEITYENHMIQKNQNQLDEKKKTDQAVLRRLAIHQLRQALKTKNSQDMCDRVDKLSFDHTEKVQSMLLESQNLVNRTVFQPRTEPGSYDDCLYYGKIRRPETAMDVHQRQMKHQQYIDERNERFKKEIQMSQTKTIKAKQLQESELQSLISHRQVRLEKNEDTLIQMQKYFNERDQKLAARGEKRQIHIQDVNNRNIEIEARRVQKALNKMEIQAKKSSEVLQQNEEIMQKRIDIEKEILKKRNTACEQIMTARKKKLDEYARHLDERDAGISRRLNDMKEVEIRKLNDIKMELEDKTEKVLRDKRSRDVSYICSLRQKIARNNNGIAEVRQKRAKSEFSKVIANDQFIEKRNKVINLAPQFINMSDKKRIETLIQVLEISEDEARDILESAKKKPSLH